MPPPSLAELRARTPGTREFKILAEIDALGAFVADLPEDDDAPSISVAEAAAMPAEDAPAVREPRLDELHWALPDAPPAVIPKPSAAEIAGPPPTSLAPRPGRSVGSTSALSEEQRLRALVRGHAVIPRKHFAPEADLLLTKWPAYRFMSPLKATVEFAHAYAKAYKRCLERHSDRDHARRSNPLGGLNFHANSSQLTQLWVARQHADRFFIPYDQYLEFAFDFWMRRERKRPNQPNQLRPSSPKQVTAWEAEFAKFWTADRLSLALHRMDAMAQYASSKRAGWPAWTSYRDTLLGVAQEGAVSLNSLVGTHVVNRRHFGAEDVATVLARSP